MLSSCLWVYSWTLFTHRVRWSFVILAIALAAFGGLWGCKPASERPESGMARIQAPLTKSTQMAAPMEVIPITVATVIRKPITVYIQGISTVEGVAQVEVLTQVAGLVTEVEIEEGQVVERGQRLAQLDDHEARLAFNRARVQLAEAELVYTSLVHLDQKEAELELQRTQLTAQEALATYHRLLSMSERGLVSQREVEAAKTQKLVADVRVQQAQNRLQYKTIDDARFRYEQAKTKLQEAKLELSYTIITAPIRGVISVRQVVEGQFVAVQQPIVTIVDTAQLLARTFLPEKVFTQIQVGQGARVIVEALAAESLPAKVKLISPVVDTDSGTFKVTVEIFPPSPRLKPGMFVTVFIRVSKRDKALVIPKRALISDRSKPMVYRVRDGRAYQVPLTLGLVDGEQVEILSGLAAGDQVAVRGQDQLVDGTAVRVMARAAVVQRPLRQE